MKLTITIKLSFWQSVRCAFCFFKNRGISYTLEVNEGSIRLKTTDPQIIIGTTLTFEETGSFFTSANQYSKPSI